MYSFICCWFCAFDREPCYIVQAGLELTTPLPHPPNVRITDSGFFFFFFFFFSAGNGTQGLMNARHICSPYFFSFLLIILIIPENIGHHLRGKDSFLWVLLHCLTPSMHQYFLLLPFGHSQPE
jgi:hypothetical protein